MDSIRRLPLRQHQQRSACRVLLTVGALLTLATAAAATPTSDAMNRTLVASTTVDDSAVASPLQHATVLTRMLQSAADVVAVVPFSSPDVIADTLAHGLAFIMVLFAAHPLGLFFPKFFRLPLITGYLVIGILAGPFIANLLSKPLVEMLAPTVNAMALSFISFQAGQEIYLPELKPQIKDILKLLLILYSVTMVLLTIVITFFNDPFFYASFDTSCQLAIGLLFGSIGVLGSPATVMAIKIELNSVGPFTNLMLGATMTAEFIVLVSFSISRIFSSIYCAKLDISVANLFFTMGVVLSNLIIGGLLGGVIIAIFCIPGGPHDAHMDMEAPPVGASAMPLARKAISRGDVDLEAHAVDPDNAPHPHNAYVEEHDAEDEHTGGRTRHHWLIRTIGSLYFKGFIWLFMGFLFYIGTATISEATIAGYGHVWDVKFEPLLVLMTASCLAGHYATIRHDMHVILDTAAPYMFLPFFVMTGAALKLDQVAKAIPLMSLYVLLRYVAIFIACYCGGRFVLKLTPKQYNNLWLTMTPQAGVALGLANEIKGLSADPWAAEFAATIVAAIVVNQIIGPVLCAIGLKRAGESQYERMAAAAKAADERTDYAGPTSRMSALPSMRHGAMPRSNSVVVTAGNGDPRPLLPFFKVQHAVVIGEDPVAFEIALELSLYGAQVNVPLLDEALAAKWQQMNEAIRTRSANGELISYRNKLKDRPVVSSNDELRDLATSTDVLVFTGDPLRALDHVKAMTDLLETSSTTRPRMIAIVPDCTYSKELKDLGVLTIQPSIALANIATRMALLEPQLAEALSNELSTTSNFATAAYFMQRSNEGDDDARASVHSLSDLRLQGRRLALGRSVVNHHSVDYDRLAEALAAENLPLPPPPSRVSMFGTSAVGHDPFRKRDAGMSAYEHFVVDDDVVSGQDGSNGVFDEQFIVGASPRSSFGSSQRSRSKRLSRRRSRVGSDASSGSYFRLRRGESSVN